MPGRPRAHAKKNGVPDYTGDPVQVLLLSAGAGRQRDTSEWKNWYFTMASSP
jgi:hypothetical protein